MLSRTDGLGCFATTASTPGSGVIGVLKKEGGWESAPHLSQSLSDIVPLRCQHRLGKRLEHVSILDS